MQKVNKDQRNGPHDLDWYADQYIDKYPHIVPPEGLSDGGLRVSVSSMRTDSRYDGISRRRLLISGLHWCPFAVSQARAK